MRLDSKLESAGAEYLVLGHLLVEGIHAYQAYANQRDFDIVAADPEQGTSCRIQVKSRWATDSNRHFPISKLGSDFVVLVSLNRGIRYRKLRETDEPGGQAPEFYVLPIDVVKSVHRPGSMSVVRLSDIPDRESYRDAWSLVSSFLDAPPAGEST